MGWSPCRSFLDSGVFWSQLDQEVPLECYPLPEFAMARLCSLFQVGPAEVSKFEPVMKIVAQELRLGGQFTAQSVREMSAGVTKQYDELWPQQLTQASTLRGDHVPPSCL